MKQLMMRPSSTARLSQGSSSRFAVSSRPSATFPSSSSRRSCVPLAQADSGSNGSSGQDNNERKSYNVRKGKQFENARRRRGRPAHLRSPYDSPLRDGNRDRLIGLLTERAAKTLMVYLMETNANVYSWLVGFYKQNPIPKNGSWDEVSGEAFLRKLLAMPIEEAKFNTGRDSLFDNVRSCGVDPRSIAQRIMDIRSQLSEEFIQELQAIAEENSVLLRETLQTSLASSMAAEVAEDPAAADSSSSSEGKDATSSSSDGGTPGAVAGTPPPSPEPAVSSSSSNKPSQQQPTAASSSSGDAQLDKAAAVAKLNAALKKTAGGAGSSASSHPELQQGSSGNSADSLSSTSSSSGSSVDMADVLASLKRAMEADVARDVLKMKESTAGGSSSSDGSSAAPADADAGRAAASLDPTAAPPAEAAASTDAEAADSAQAEPTAAAAGAGADGGNEEGGSDSTGASSTASDGASSAPQLSSSAVGEAGTYSRMLPKGWGPRLGVGFSRYPRSRNNIVSTANLGVSPAAAGGDGASGSGAASAAEEAAA